MRTARLDSIRDQVRYRADIVSETSRHTNAQLNKEINQAIVELRSRLTQDGSELYLGSATGTLTTVSGGTGENYVSITGPATAEQIVRIDILDNDTTVPLDYVGMRAKLSVGADVIDGQRPMGWGLLNLDTREIAIYPIPDEAYTYVIWYQTQHTDLSADDDTYTVLPGFFDFIVWHACRMIAVRDDLPHLLDQAARLSAEAYSTARQAAVEVGATNHRRMNTRLHGGPLTAAGRFRAQ